MTGRAFQEERRPSGRPDEFGVNPVTGRAFQKERRPSGRPDEFGVTP